MHRESGLEAQDIEPSCNLCLYSCKNLSEAASGPAGEEAGAVLRPTWQMAFGAYKVLCAQSSWSVKHCSGTLGVSDDVDCAELQVSLMPEADAPTVRHVASMPALAYVVSGKTQRKHLLLGEPAATCGVGAVLVEMQRYAYAYRRTDLRQAYGEQQLLDLQLEADDMVMGDRLLPYPDERLLVLTKRLLLCYARPRGQGAL